MFEKIVVGFLKKKHGKAEFPIDTEELKTMIEGHVTDLDQFADLSCYGPGVEGLTEFPPGEKPRVAISETLHRNENRLRTTLTHEFGHVQLHAYLFALEPRQLVLGPNQKANAIYCKRDTMLPIGKADWMEWQAGYACGAVLMPRSFVVHQVAEVQNKHGIYGPVPAETPKGQAMIDAVVEAFAVSRDAARVRLSVLGYIGAQAAAGSLFS